MQSYIHRAEPLQLVSHIASNQYGSSYNHSFIAVIVSHCCKEVLIGLLHAEKIAESVCSMYLNCILCFSFFVHIAIIFLLAVVRWTNLAV